MAIAEVNTAPLSGRAARCPLTAGAKSVSLLRVTSVRPVHQTHPLNAANETHPALPGPRETWARHAKPIMFIGRIYPPAPAAPDGNDGNDAPESPFGEQRRAGT